MALLQKLLGKVDLVRANSKSMQTWPELLLASSVIPLAFFTIGVLSCLYFAKNGSFLGTFRFVGL